MITKLKNGMEKAAWAIGILFGTDISKEYADYLENREAIECEKCGNTRYKYEE